MKRLAAIVALITGVPLAASAQDDRGASVGATVSSLSMDSRTDWSIAGSFEYRFNRVAGLEVEATLAPSLTSPYPYVSVLTDASAFSTPLSFSDLAAFGFLPTFPTIPTIFPPPRVTNERGRAVFFTNNVRVHIPTTIARVDPYFVAGGGVASVRHSADLVYGPFSATPLPGFGVLPAIPATTQRLTRSTVDLALTLGGGIGVRVAPQVWIEGDLRLIRLQGETDRNVGRFGAGLRYRFGR